jgi:hypothetical protein
MRRVVGMVGAGALIAGLLTATTGCSQSASLVASEDQRTPIARDGGNELTIPALWADEQAGTSGTEPARIWATQEGSSQFTIDLADIRAEGAGAQWTAASAAAAAVGSMVSGINPGRVDVDFGVSGPIDGPSAGAILTVGVMAALLGAPIRGDMTMTGTISPDGAVGPIGGVDLKLRAAADQGYRTVLLPVANMKVRNRETDQVESAIDMGRQLGLEVILVGNVQQAFTKFTDGRFAYPSAPAFDLPGDVRGLVAIQTTDLLAELEGQLGKLADGDIKASIANLAGTADQAENQGDTAVAYGVGMQALNMANREVASNAAQAAIASDGVAGATTWLRDWTSTATKRNDALLIQAAQSGSTLGYEQQLTLPNALSWLTYNAAILASVQQRLDGGLLTEGDIDRFARVLADVDAAIDIYCPNQLAIVQASPAKPTPGDSVVAGYLADYTTFLIRAGQAQQEYVQQVLMRGQDPAELAKQNDVGLLLPSVLNLSEAVAAIPPSQDVLADELVQATTAITYYIATTSLIAAIQDFGVYEFGIGADPMQAEQGAVLDASVATASKAVDEVSALLGQRGLDASLPVWAAAYGRAAAEALSQTPQATAADTLALNELYFDSITVFMLQSGPVQ